MSQHTLIPRPFIDAPLRGVARWGISRNQVLEKSGLALRALDDPNSSLNHHQYTLLMSRLWQLANDEFMGLAPNPSPYGSFAMMCKAILSCSSLEHALHRANHFYQLFPHSPSIHLSKEGSTTRLIIQHDTSHDPEHFLSESLLVIWHRLSSWLVGQGIPLFAVGCHYPAPAHAKHYATLFDCPVHFEQQQSYLVIPSKSLSLKLCQTSASLRAFLRHSPADLLARPNPHKSTRGQVRQLLLQTPLAELPSLAASANQLGLSSATLRRRLAAEQTSFQSLKDELKHSEALDLLQQPDMAIKDIAEHLGFTETSTFHRAFLKWHGITPGQYRAESALTSNSQAG